MYRGNRGVCAHCKNHNAADACQICGLQVCKECQPHWKTCHMEFSKQIDLWQPSEFFRFFKTYKSVPLLDRGQVLRAENVGMLSIKRTVFDLNAGVLRESEKLPHSSAFRFYLGGGCAIRIVTAGERYIKQLINIDDVLEPPEELDFLPQLVSWDQTKEWRVIETDNTEVLFYHPKTRKMSERFDPHHKQLLQAKAFDSGLKLFVTATWGECRVFYCDGMELKFRRRFEVLKGDVKLAIIKEKSVFMVVGDTAVEYSFFGKMIKKKQYGFLAEFNGFGALRVDRYTVSPCKEYVCLLYTSPSPRDATLYRMPSSA